MSSVKEQLLDYIIAASVQNKGPQAPNGFCYLPATHAAPAQELHTDELIVAHFAQKSPTDGSFPVMPTDTGIKWAAAAKVQPNGAAAPQPAAQRQQPAPAANAAPANFAVELEDGIAAPERRRFGRQPDENHVSKVDQFPFATMNVGQSFFIPNGPNNTADKPIHRTFSSVVSQANKKHHPRNFRIAPAERNGVSGARVFREPDLQGARPTRTRKPKAPAPVAGTLAPQLGATDPMAGVQFPPQGGFAGGFPAPGAAPPFPTAFPAPGGAPGFGAAPSFPAPAGQGGFLAPGAPPAPAGEAPAFPPPGFGQFDVEG